MDKMGFESCKANPDIWFRSDMKDKGTDYYQYVLLYTDDIMAIMQKPEDFIRHDLGKRFVVKPKSIKPQTQYLRNKVSYVTFDNGRNTWSFISSRYVQYAVKNAIDTLAKEGRNLPKQGKSPCTSNYRRETGTSPDLHAPRAVYYQYLICVL